MTTLRAIMFLLLFGCGTDAPTPPIRERVIFTVPVPSTDTIGASCPDGHKSIEGAGRHIF